MSFIPNIKFVLLAIFVSFNCLLVFAFEDTTTYITVWDSRNTESEFQASDSNHIVIPGYGDYTYNYVQLNQNYDTIPGTEGSGSFSTTVLDTIEVATPGIYRIEIVRDFTNGNPFHQIDFLSNSFFDQVKLIKIEQWGDIEWSSFENAYYWAFELDDIAAIDVPILTSVTNMSNAFANVSLTSINRMNEWDVSQVTDMSYMFISTYNFNQDISDWDVSNVQDMSSMFEMTSAFNQDIGDWDVSSVVYMRNMFLYAEVFNQDIGDWDVSNVQDMYALFQNATNFNQDISDWNVNQVKDMSYIFSYATSFDQNLGEWNLENLGNDSPGYAYFHFDFSGMSCENFSLTLYGWAQYEDIADSVFLYAYDMYASSDPILSSVFSTLNGHQWSVMGYYSGYCSNVITDAFISIWQTTNTGTSLTNQVTLPFTGDYICNWVEVDAYFDTLNPTSPNIGSGTWSGMHTVDFPNPGIYRIKITPNQTSSTPFNRLKFNNEGDKDKIIRIEQWGNSIPWQDFSYAFYGATNLIITATDIPNLDSVTNMSYAFASTGITDIPNFEEWDLDHVTNTSGMFKDVTGYAPNVENWDMSNIVNMQYMFAGAENFNQDISNWDVSNVQYMDSMFAGASSFNQDISNWDVSQVQNMKYMFVNATNFNKDISNWDVSNVTNMEGMFMNANTFNGISTNSNGVFEKIGQGIGDWDVSKVTNMKSMFQGATNFNQDIGDWDVSKVADMSYMFSGANSFNQYIGSWDVDSVENMEGMFLGAENFNNLNPSDNLNEKIGQGIGDWDVSKVTNMKSMFQNAPNFNQNIGDWDVSKVSNMQDMFLGATNFNQNIGNWDVSKLALNNNGTNNDISFNQSGMSCENYSRTIYGWANNPSPGDNITIDATGMSYANDVLPYRDNLVSNFGWTITGDLLGTCITVLATENLDHNQLKIYPNPMRDEFEIEGLNGDESIKIFDHSGRIVKELISTSSIELIHVGDLENGMYTVLIQDKDGRAMSIKISKQ